MRTQHFPQHQSRRPFLGVALWVMCALVAHCFDNCAAHIGELTRFQSSVPSALQVLAPCSGNNCQFCAHSKSAPSDACELISENAVLKAAHTPLEVPSALSVAIFATIPATPQMVALSGSLHGRAEPPPHAWFSASLRSSLPSRAPPVSA